MTKTGKILMAGFIIIILVAIGFYFNQSSTTQTTTPPPAETSSIQGCYIAKLSNDVYGLNITSQNATTVTGMLAYNNAEKDSSSGTISGTFTNNVLLATYSFSSEGMDSTRQVIFKKDGDNLVEGFGDVTTSGNSETLVDPTKVTYDPNSTFVKSADCTTDFTASNGSFSFKYNPLFKASAGDATPTIDWMLNSPQKGNLLVTVTTPQNYMPKTNFGEAKFTIGSSNDKTAVKNCLVDMSGNKAVGAATTVSGYPFTKLVFGDAGAGNLYDTTSYRGVVGGSCYAIEYTIHSANIGNYSPDQGITQFDKTKITNELEGMVQSLHLIVASN